MHNGYSPSLAHILDRRDRFVARYPHLRGGPGYVVLDGLNLENQSIDWCLRTLDTPHTVREWNRDDLERTRLFLQGLRDVPEWERLGAMWEYQGVDVAVT